MDGASMVDAALELPVVTSFTRLGYDARRRLDHWTPLDRYDLTGRVVVVTGATSGLGRVGAEQLARCGASVVLWGRDGAKTERVRDELAAATGSSSLEVALAVLTEREVVPERIQEACTPEALAEALLRPMLDPAVAEAQRAGFAEALGKLRAPEGLPSDAAAEAVLKAIEE